jgi:NADPH-dependent 2,4-dienoyl-CoA reductase/sulfur reductase-like enzyme/peroxiredoxin family protein/rhodanese-related sulfurtransferase/TusA-related sulfurtransferase
MKILIVGGVAGGASTAARLRRVSEDAQIILFEKTAYISYANCGLPYYLGGTITKRDKLVVTKPELLRDRFSIDVRTNCEVLSIDRKKKTVKVRNTIDQKEYTEGYDKLVLSPGATPRKLKIPGEDLPGIFTLRNLENTIEIDDYIVDKDPARAVVIGGGFIGIEIAENLKHRGLDVEIVEYADQVLAFLDKETVTSIHKRIKEAGINLYLGTGVTGFRKEGAKDQITVELTKGSSLTAEMVILAAGVVPDSHLATDCGLETGAAGSILVDDRFTTSDPNIFAVGDAISVKSLVSGKEVLIPLAGPANRQGRQIAGILVGKDPVNETSARIVQGSSIIKIFDLTAAATGLNERQIKAAGIDYLKTYIYPSSHATYYPNATGIMMKMLFDRSGKILGAQAVGYEGVDKRMDVLATAMRLGATVYDLQNLELCYAPPYTSAKDPVNMLGFTAANILKGDVKVFYPENVDGLLEKGAFFLDTRTSIETDLDHIPGAVSIPIDELRKRLSELPKDKPIYTYCQVGLRGYVAARILTQNGFDAYNLSGGFRLYKEIKEDSGFSGTEGESKMPATEGSKSDTSNLEKTSDAPVTTVDACGLACPGPIMKAAAAMKEIDDGSVLEITATDSAFGSDIQVWAERTGNTILSVNKDKGVISAVLRKGLLGGADASDEGTGNKVISAGNDKTIVVFSGDLDKAIASFIIANGAAAMGRKVTMFFTFWGLNLLRKPKHVKVSKGFIEKMFGVMMPRGSGKLGLSRMNMAGIGPKMIRGIMKKKNVQSLEELIQAAMNSGIRLLACQMSMDVMGIKEEELLDGVEMAGVATYLGAAETSDTNLFI